MGTSFDLNIPDQSGVSVRFPGVVRNDTRAISMLGGEKEVSDALTKNSMLRCYLRPKDPFSHPLFSTEGQPHKLLLKMQRCGGTDEDPEYEAVVVCRLTANHEFKGMADFQVVTACMPDLDRSKPPVHPLNRKETAEPLQDEHPFSVLPPLFIKNDTPTDYCFQGFSRKDFSTAIVWAPAKKLHTTAWTAATPALATVNLFAELRAQNEAMFKTVEDMFAAKHVCMYPALREATAKMGSVAILETILQKLAYRFVAGPWRGALIRKGYNPRTEQSAWQFQVLMYLLPASWMGSMLQHELDSTAGSGDTPWSSGLDLLSGQETRPAIATSQASLLTMTKIPSTKSSFFQVCDLIAAGLISAPPLLETCHDRSGWIPAGHWQTAGDRLAAKLNALLPTWSPPKNNTQSTRPHAPPNPPTTLPTTTNDTANDTANDAANDDSIAHLSNQLHHQTQLHPASTSQAAAADNLPQPSTSDGHQPMDTDEVQDAKGPNNVEHEVGGTRTGAPGQDAGLSGAAGSSDGVIRGVVDGGGVPADLNSDWQNIFQRISARVPGRGGQDEPEDPRRRQEESKKAGTPFESHPSSDTRPTTTGASSSHNAQNADAAWNEGLHDSLDDLLQAPDDDDDDIAFFEDDSDSNSDDSQGEI